MFHSNAIIHTQPTFAGSDLKCQQNLHQVFLDVPRDDSLVTSDIFILSSCSLLPPLGAALSIDCPELLGPAKAPQQAHCTHVLFWMSLPPPDTTTLWPYCPSNRLCCLPQQVPVFQGWSKGNLTRPLHCCWETGEKVSFSFSCEILLKIKKHSNMAWLISINYIRNNFSVVKLGVFRVCAWLDYDKDIWNTFLAVFVGWVEDQGNSNANQQVIVTLRYRLKLIHTYMSHCSYWTVSK